MLRTRAIFTAGAVCAVFSLALSSAEIGAQETPETPEAPASEPQEPQRAPEASPEPPPEPPATLDEPSGESAGAPVDDMFGSALGALRDMFPLGEDAGAAPDAAAEAEPTPPQPDYETDPDIARIDKLFLRLANLSEEHAHAADGLASDILAELSRHESPTAELLLKRARLASRTGRSGQAVDHATRAIAFQPDFAEAWHFRATIYFEQNQYGLAIRDLNQALRAEPRHFAAWVGLGVILEELGEKDAAVAAYRSALAWHPYLARAQEKLQELEDEMYGQPA